MHLYLIVDWLEQYWLVVVCICIWLLTGWGMHLYLIVDWLEQYWLVVVCICIWLLTGWSNIDWLWYAFVSDCWLVGVRGCILLLTAWSKTLYLIVADCSKTLFLVCLILHFVLIFDKFEYFLFNDVYLNLMFKQSFFVSF